jgi:hypothetical protein
MLLWESITIAYSECVFVALVIQRAKRMRLIILPSVVCPLYNIFPHHLINSMIFEKKKFLNKKYVF